MKSLQNYLSPTGHWCFSPLMLRSASIGMSGFPQANAWWQQQPLRVVGEKLGLSLQFPPLIYILVFCSDIIALFHKCSTTARRGCFRVFWFLYVVFFLFCMSNWAAESLMQTLGRWNGPSTTKTQLSLQQQVAEKVNFVWREAGVFYIFSKKSQARLHWQGPDAYSENISGKSQWK